MTHFQHIDLNFVCYTSLVAGRLLLSTHSLMDKTVVSGTIAAGSTPAGCTNEFSSGAPRPGAVQYEERTSAQETGRDCTTMLTDTLASATMHPITAELKLIVAAALRTVAPSVSTEVVNAISFEHPADDTHGDYATNCALVAHAELRKNFASPRELATQLVDALTERGVPTSIASVSVAGPGFINFFLSEQFLLEETKKIVQKKTNQNKLLEGQRVMLEFTDPNPFKELHIGHAYSNTVGEAIARVFEALGASVRRVCYQGDVGMHVAKSVWGLRQILAAEYTELSEADALSVIGAGSASQRQHLLGRAYARGATAYTDDEEAAAEIKEMNLHCFRAAQEHLAASSDWQPSIQYATFLTQSTVEYEPVRALYLAGRAWSLEYFDLMYKRLGMQFDDFFFESQVGELGLEIVHAFLEKGVFRQSQGAVIYPGSEQGLHDRVFVNSMGLPTYEAKELGLAPEKYRRWPYDHSVIITGNEIDEYFQVLMAALSQTHPDLRDRTVHLSHGMVRLPEGKMSSRTGDVLTAEWLLDEAAARVSQVLDQRESISADQKASIAAAVGLGAIKFAFLQSSIGKDIAFSFDASLSFSGKSGPYVQYALVRAQSIIAAIETSTAVSIDTLMSSKVGVSETATTEQKSLLRYSYLYSEVVAQAAHDHAPHYLAEYAYHLSQRFSVWYQSGNLSAAVRSERADGGSLSEATQLDLWILLATAELLEQTLSILGIPVVREM